MRTEVIVQNEIELISLALAKKHLRLEVDDDEDELVQLAIASAISQAENYTERKLAKVSLVLLLENANAFHVEKQSLNDCIVKVAIQEDDIEIILPETSYKTTKRGIETYEVSFVGVDLQPNQTIAVYVDYGFDAETLPKPIKSAILLMIGDAYEKREDRNVSNNSAANNLLRPYRKWR